MKWRSGIALYSTLETIDIGLRNKPTMHSNIRDTKFTNLNQDYFNVDVTRNTFGNHWTSLNAVIEVFTYLWPLLSATIKSPTLYHSLEASHGSFDDSKLIFAFLVEDVNMGSLTLGQTAEFSLSVVLCDHHNTKIEKNTKVSCPLCCFFDNLTFNIV